MVDYLKLGYMRPLTEQELEKTRYVAGYLTHHSVLRQKADGQRLRFVFNASRLASSLDGIAGE